MNFEEFRAFAESKMETDFTSIPIEFENLTESAALVAAKNAKTPWSRFVIRDGDGNLITIGSDVRLDRFAGVMIAQVFVIQGSGTKAARGYADDISAIWKGFSGEPCLQFFTPAISVIGETSGWFQININIPFQNDEQT